MAWAPALEAIRDAAELLDHAPVVFPEEHGLKVLAWLARPEVKAARDALKKRG